MSPESIELAQEVREVNAAQQALLDYSRQSTYSILPENMNQQTEQEVRNLSQSNTSSSMEQDDYGLHTGLSQDFVVIDLESTECDQYINFESVQVKTEVDSEKLESLKKHIEYHTKLLEFYKQLDSIFQERGHKAAEEFELKANLHKKPIPVTFQNKREKKSNVLTSLRGSELLEGLKNHLYYDGSTSESLLFSTRTTDIEELKQKLLVCEKQYKSKATDTLKIVVVYGQYLEVLRNRHFGRYKGVCLEVLRITPRWARDLINISILLKTYPKFQQLNLPIKTMLSLRKHIHQALENNEEEAAFWIVPGTVNMQSGIVRDCEQSGIINTIKSEQSGVGASRNSMEEGDTGVVSDVKIEIDVAEDMPQCCYRTEQLQYVPFMEVVVTDNTATMPTVQTLEGQVAVNTHRDIWLKHEIQTPVTQTAVNSGSGTWLKQEIQTLETQTAVSTYSDTWLKQEIQTPRTQTAVSTHSDTWLKQEIQTPATQAAVNTPSDTCLKQEIQTPETQTAVSTHSDTWLKQEIQTPATQAAVNTPSDTCLKQEIQTPETQTAVSTHIDTWLKQETQTPETQTAVSTYSDTWLKQEIQTPATQTAVNTPSDTCPKQEIQTPETQTAVSMLTHTGEKRHA
ncbi:uncharacterized protein [Littorina saxatilis]|uniref:uncharacterized protein isoform X2 n=1 Tax=Littorina saxatilis TaxID=31220 RepID=UPI0038B42A46